MKNKLKVVEALSMVVQIGLNMIVSIFLCLALGLYIDKHFGTSLTVFFLVFGIISGYCGVYSTFKTLIERSTKDADALYAGLGMPEEEAGRDVPENENGMNTGCDISGDRIEDDGFEGDEAEAVGDEQRP